MQYKINVIHNGQRIQTLDLAPFAETDSHTMFNLSTQLLDIPTDPLPATPGRRRRRRGVGERLFDAENGFPVLRELIKEFAPVLMQMLSGLISGGLASAGDDPNDAQSA